MSDNVREAQEETGALLANLMKGAADLVCTTAKSDIRPTYFAWNKKGTNSERLSEMSTAFPVHDVTGSRPGAFKAPVGESPIIKREGFGANKWASENRANYPSMEEEGEDEDAPAGCAYQVGIWCYINDIY